MTGEVAALPDAGPCGWCGDAQWDHKRGKAGCKVLGCPCGQYEPPATGPVPAAAKPEPTCAYPNGEDEGEHDHAMCEDVVAERDELAGVVDADPGSPVPGVLEERPDDADPGDPVAGPEPAQPGDVDLEPAADVDDEPSAERTIVLTHAEATQLYAELERRRADEEQIRQLTADRDRLASRLDIIRQQRRREHLAHQVATLTAERDAAVAQRADEQAARQRADAEAEAAQRRVEVLAGELAAEQAAVTRLRTELGRANARAQGAKTRLDKAIVAGAEAATRVLWRYDAEQCLDCGSRFTKWVDHEHPLTPVTVLVVAREVAGA